MWRDPALRPLSHQHQHGLALSVIVRRAAEPAEELGRKIGLAWDAELRAHFEVEERLLFPAVRERIAEPTLADRLIAEHRRIEALVAAIRAAPAAGRLAEFAEVLAAHIRTEERELFQQIQAAIAADELAALGAQLEAELARVCPATGLPWETGLPGAPPTAPSSGN